MANIRQLMSGNWNVQVRLAGKLPRSQTFHTLNEAETWANALEGNARYLHPTFVKAGTDYANVVLGSGPINGLLRQRLI